MTTRLLSKVFSISMAPVLFSLGLSLSSQAPAAAAVPLSLTAAQTQLTPGQSLTLTIHDPGANPSMEYELGIGHNGRRYWTGFHSQDHITLTHLPAGTYVITGYALSSSMALRHQWTMAQASNRQVIYVGSKVSIAVAEQQVNGQAADVVHVNSQGIASPVYLLTWKGPSGETAMQGFQESSNFVIPITQSGAYHFVAYAEPYGGPPGLANALGSNPMWSSVQIPAQGVTLNPAVRALRAGSQAMEAIDVNVTAPGGQLLSTFTGSVLVTDSAGQLLTPSGATVNSLTVEISNGQGTFSLLAGQNPSLDNISTASLTPSGGNVVAAHVQYGMTSIAFRGSGGNIGTLQTIMPIASTVNPQNGDQTPYGLVYDSFAGTATAPNPYYGDLFVSNFSNQAQVNGAGSTIVAINPNTGSTTPFASGLSGPVALAVSPKGPVWVADFGTQGTNGNDMVLAPNGMPFANGGSVIANPLFDGPWGQVFVPNATSPAFLETNGLNGTIAAMYGFAPPNFNQDTQVSIIGSGLAHQGTTASTVLGPQGMVYDSSTNMVYVTDSQDNSIRAFYWDGSTTPNQGQGQLIYQGGGLNKPAGITLDPLNGDLLVVNQGNNRLVEVALNNGHAYIAGQKTLDPTPVNPMTGAGSALFGVAARVSANGHLEVYFTDDNTNTVDVLK